jgi:ABC-2 type transport system permease protein
MTFAATTWLFFRTHVGRFFVSRRALVGAALALLPGLLALVLAHMRHGPGAREIAANLGVLVELQVVVPLLALIVGSAVIAEEVEDRTITFLFTRPVPRPALLFGRWLAALVFVAVALSVSATLMFLAASTASGAASTASGTGAPIDWAFARPLFEATLLAGAVYSAWFAVAGVFFRHPILVGLGYAFAIEGFLANLPGGNALLTVQHHARSWLVARGPDAWREIEAFELQQFEPAANALLWLAAFLALALVLGAWRISRREFVLGA